MVLTSPFCPCLVVTIERVFASVRVHTDVEVLSLPLKEDFVTTVSDFPSGDQVAVDLLSPLPVVFTLSLPSRVYFVTLSVPS